MRLAADVTRKGTGADGVTVAQVVGAGHGVGPALHTHDELAAVAGVRLVHAAGVALSLLRMYTIQTREQQVMTRSTRVETGLRLVSLRVHCRQHKHFLSTQ